MGDVEERFEDHPLTRGEYINAMAHFYRAEVQRSLNWRQRLDATTNWAVLTAAGMLSLSFGSPDAPHFVMLASNFIVLAFLGIEARRYRYFALYQARVRMLEENFLIPIVTRRLESPMPRWRESLAGDLDLPKYKTTFLQAVGFRLRRNYVWIFAMVSGGWVVKVATQPTLANSAEIFWRRMAVGHVPPEVVLGAGLVFWGLLLGGMVLGRQLGRGELDEEIAGLEANLDEWKL